MKKIILTLLAVPFLLIPTKDDIKCPNGPVYIKIIDGAISISCEVAK